MGLSFFPLPPIDRGSCPAVEPTCICIGRHPLAPTIREPEEQEREREDGVDRRPAGVPVDGARVRGEAHPAVAGAGDGARRGGEPGAGRGAQRRHDEPGVHVRDHPFAQHLRRAAGLLPPQGLDEPARPDRRAAPPLHPPGERRRTDLRRRLRQHDIQRYAIFILRGLLSCSREHIAVSLSGGFGSYLLGMDRKTADVPGSNISEPTLGRTMAFFFLVSFVGLLVIVPMRKVRMLCL